MMLISELPLGIFDQADQKRHEQHQLSPLEATSTHLSKLEQKHKTSMAAAVAARKLSGIMIDKWSDVQGKNFL